jgi:hypothetical protein
MRPETHRLGGPGSRLNPPECGEQTRSGNANGASAAACVARIARRGAERAKSIDGTPPPTFVATGSIPDVGEPRRERFLP